MAKITTVVLTDDLTGEAAGTANEAANRSAYGVGNGETAYGRRRSACHS